VPAGLAFIYWLSCARIAARAGESIRRGSPMYTSLVRRATLYPLAQPLPRAGIAQWIDTGSQN
jgi:hypothetical protein